MTGKPFTILVCGGRNYWGRATLYHKLSSVCMERGLFPEPLSLEPFRPNVHIIAGDATGADTFAAEWAAANQVPFTKYEADWEANGKAAGPIRNQRMLDEGACNLVIAFPGGKGTADMVRRAKKAGIEVVEVPNV